MSKINQKKQLFEQCLLLQQRVIDNLAGEIEESQNQSNQHDAAGEDGFDSFIEDMKNKREMFAKQLKIAQTEFLALKKAEPASLLNTVQFGAVVLTDFQNVYVSISLGKVESEGKQYVAISVLTPLYKAIQGLKTGETCLFNGRKITILDVF